LDNNLLWIRKLIKTCDNFSEDIDIHITPPSYLQVDENPASTKKTCVDSRKKFYDWLVTEIKIDGIISVKRDRAFDDEMHYRSGGIRLKYKSYAPAVEGLKEGILLEAGFDTVTPNETISISSWAFDHARESGVDLIDNRAQGILCYHPGYTFIEKLQTIATKFRQEQEGGKKKPNYMRQYYDISCLLENEIVQKFIGSEEYFLHKEKRFPKRDLNIPIESNQAFLLTSGKLRTEFKERFSRRANLYYKGQPDFEEILKKISAQLHKL
jgi:hypothetical protein